MNDEQLHDYTELVMEQCTENILRLYESADEETVKHGMSWYSSAHDIAKELHDRYFLASVSHAAGVISVLSPAVNWDRNIVDAEAVCAAMPGTDVTVSTYGYFKEKAFAIRDGDDPIKWINPRTAPKTYAFWKNIKDPDNAAHVTIDRHALAACFGRLLTDRERSNTLKRVGMYNHFSQVYKDAASVVGILPSQLQAVCWIEWRLKHA